MRRSPAVLGPLHEADLRVYAAAARFGGRRLDRPLRVVTNAANHGVLWGCIAGALAASGDPRLRRAATRGLLSLGLASAVANGPFKAVSRRGRPDVMDVPVVRRLARQPSSSSFPSGHSASAAAFATGVALEVPLLGVPVGVLAAAVAYGRVHTGVHYPLDVAAGVATGAGAALLLRRVWPVREDAAAAAEAPAADVPALPDGDGLVVVANARAGGGDPDAETDDLPLRGEVAAELARARVIGVGPDDDVVAVLRSAAADARVLGVAGGDGTVACAAGVAAEAGIPLAVFPTGTLNHFAGELGLRTVGDTLAAVASGCATSVSLSALVDADGRQNAVLNTFSIGIYPELVHERERREDWLGKWPALLVALARVMGRAAPTELEVDGVRRSVWLLFAGNGRYHPAGFAPSWRERLDSDELDVRVVDGTAPWARTRLVAAVATGRLGRSRVYSARTQHELSLGRHGEHVRLAHDGEVEERPAPVTLQAGATTLPVYRRVER